MGHAAGCWARSAAHTTGGCPLRSVGCRRTSKGAGRCPQDTAWFHRQMEKAASHSWPNRMDLLLVRVKTLKRDGYGIVRSPLTICAGHWNCFLLHLWPHVKNGLGQKPGAALRKSSPPGTSLTTAFGGSERQLQQGRFAVGLMGAWRSHICQQLPGGWQLPSTMGGCVPVAVPSGAGRVQLAAV